MNDAKWLPAERRWSFNKVNKGAPVDFADRMVNAACLSGALFVFAYLIWERV